MEAAGHAPCSSPAGVPRHPTIVSGGGYAITANELLTELQESKSDMVRLVDAVRRNRMPYILVPSAAVRTWARRESEQWAKMSGWLAAENVAAVQV